MAIAEAAIEDINHDWWSETDGRSESSGESIESVAIEAGDYFTNHQSYELIVEIHLRQEQDFDARHRGNGDVGYLRIRRVRGPPL